MASSSSTKFRNKILFLVTVLCIPALFACNALSAGNPAPLPSTAPAGVVATNTPAVERSSTPALTPTLGARSAWRSSRIAFASNRTGSFQIYLMNPDGTRLVQLTTSTGDNQSPAWSSDAKHILFVSSRDGNSEIYMMNPDGTDQQNLTNDPGSDGLPVWLPGSRIAFVSDRGGRERIFVMNVDGSALQSFSQSSIDSTSHMFCLSWLQEGELFVTTEESGVRITQILDTSNGDMWVPDPLAGQPDHSCPVVSKFVNNEWTLFVTNRDGHDEIYGFKDGDNTDVPFTHTSGESLAISRSTDASWASFHSNRTGNWDIFVMNVTSKAPWDITNDPADDIQPAWEPY